MHSISPETAEKIVNLAMQAIWKAKPGMSPKEITPLVCRVLNRVCTQLEKESVKREIVKIGAHLYQLGFLPGTSGNISVRLPDGTILITPSGAQKGNMAEEEMVLTDIQGNFIEGGGKPSSETKMHLLCYQRRPDVKSIVHCHPPCATAFAASGNSLEMPVLPETLIVLGRIPLVEYGTPSTSEVPAALEPYLTDHNAFLLANHGSLTLGNDLLEASHRMETLEFFARVITTARILGGERKLTPEQVEKLMRVTGGS